MDCSTPRRETTSASGDDRPPVGSGEPTDEAIDAVAAILQALSLPLRLRIVLQVLDREATAAEISVRVGAPYQRLAHHLRHLRVVGALRRRRIDNQVRYQAAPFVVELVRRALSCVPGNVSGEAARRAHPSH